MSRETRSERPGGQKGYQPRPDFAEEQRGYQPQASGTVDPAQVKPPRGDTAIVPPQKPAAKQ